MDELFHKYHLTLSKDIHHPALIIEWKKILVLLLMKNIETNE